MRQPDDDPRADGTGGAARNAADDIDGLDDAHDPPSSSPSLRGRVLGWLVAGAGLAVCVTFVLALGAGRAGPALFVVVVTDPTPRPAPTPVLAMVVGPSSVVPFSGRINGDHPHPAVDAAVDATVVNVATADGIIVDGEAIIDGAAVPVALSISASELVALGPLRQALSASSLLTLAVPSLGPAVFPVDGLVPSRGAADVVVIDDDSVQVLTVDAARDGRLPDGRLLAVDRRPVTADLTSDDQVISLIVTARREAPVLVTLSVGGRLVRLHRARVRVERPLILSLPCSDYPTGDVVVASVSTAAVPGVTAAHELQLVERVGGVVDDDLLMIEPRAAAHLQDPRVRRALTRRLVVTDGAPRPVSPSFSAQRARQLQVAAQQAQSAHDRFRFAAVVLLVTLCGLGLSLRARMVSLATAMIIIGAIVWGLEQLLVATRLSGGA
jgi:hypothetical protein